jgi:hypothetical protein
MNDGQRCLGCTRPASTRHHVLPQQQIKRYVSALRREMPAGQKGLLRRLLADKRNLVPMCFPCHMAHESWSKRLTRDQIPKQAWDFARELGEWAVVALERAYPDVRCERNHSPRGADARPTGTDGANAHA